MGLALGSCSHGVKNGDFCSECESLRVFNEEGPNGPARAREVEQDSNRDQIRGAIFTLMEAAGKKMQCDPVTARGLAPELCLMGGAKSLVGLVFIQTFLLGEPEDIAQELGPR